MQVLDEALEAAVKFSHRYIPERQLPDKAVGLIDTTCARVAISQSAVPAAVEDARRRIEGLETELAIIDRETAIGVDTAAHRQSEQDQLEAERDRLAELEGYWEKEQSLVDRILDLRARLRGQTGEVEGTGTELEKAADETTETLPMDQTQPELEGGAQTPSPESPADDEPPPTSAPSGPEDEGQPLSAEQRAELLEELKALQTELQTLQGETPLILPSVDAQAVVAVVTDWTGIPVGHTVKNEVAAVLKLADTLNQRVIGQRHALEMIACRVQTSRARLDNPDKPIGGFMLCGPSRAGKTETGLALAKALYGGVAKHRHHQHERVPRGPYGFHPQGGTAGLRGVRRGRHPHRGGVPQVQVRTFGQLRENYHNQWVMNRPEHPLQIPREPSPLHSATPLPFLSSHPLKAEPIPSVSHPAQTATQDRERIACLVV